MINIGSERTLFRPVWPDKVLESAGRLAGDWSWEVVGPPALRHLPGSREQLGESRLHCNLPQTPPAKLPKSGALKIFLIPKKTAGYRYIGVMLKTFAKAVEDDYIMKSNGLPQLWLRNRHVEEKVPTEMTLTPILHTLLHLGRMCQNMFKMLKSEWFLEAIQMLCRVMTHESLWEPLRSYNRTLSYFWNVSVHSRNEWKLLMSYWRRTFDNSKVC